jgi:hypothetical protein
MRDSRSVKDMERIHGLRWEQLVEQEPELERLLKIARGVGDACRTWNDVLRGFSQFKNDVDRLTRAIVTRSPAPAPNGTAVWDVIYWKLHNAVARDSRGN